MGLQRHAIFMSFGGFVTALGIVSVIHSAKTLHRTPFFLWALSSVEEPIGVRVHIQEVFGFMSQCKFHFLSHVIDYKRRSIERYIGRVSIIAKELSSVTSGACH